MHRCMGEGRHPHRQHGGRKAPNRQHRQGHHKDGHNTRDLGDRTGGQHHTCTTRRQVQHRMAQTGQRVSPNNNSQQ